MPRTTVFPDWPRSSADLVPLPLCEGPKLKPFDFQGPQQIEFLEYVGEGLHAHVFKVQIRGQILALKLFRFVYNENWLGPPEDTDDPEMMSAFYDYSDPFSCECRAFGRLQEAGYEELAVGCHGYLLLDEDHERTMLSRFSDLDLGFDGDIYHPYCGGNRARFPGRDGREPPIRGIVKEFHRPVGEDELQAADMRKMLGDIIKLQQLGIFQIDPATRQLIGGKISDFSKAITVPHYITSPELNPALTPGMRAAAELETFRLAMDDYLAFDEMMHDWNLEHAEKKGVIPLRAFPGGKGSPPLRLYKLRSGTARERVFTYVDPRRFDWKRPTSRAGKRRRLGAKPPMWIYDCGENKRLATNLRRDQPSGPIFEWAYKEGLIFPRPRSS